MEIQKLKEHSSPTAQHFFASSRMNLQQTPFIQLLLGHIYSIATTETVQQRELFHSTTIPGIIHAKCRSRFNTTSTPTRRRKLNLVNR